MEENMRQQLVERLMDEFCRTRTHEPKEELDIEEIWQTCEISAQLEGMTTISEDEVNEYMLEHDYDIANSEIDGRIGWLTYVKIEKPE